MRATQEQKRRKNLFYLGIAVVVIAGAGILYGLTQQKANGSSSASDGFDPNLPAIKSQGYVLGSDSAPVKVVEFADFECPACMNYATLTEPDVRTRLVNSGQVQVRFIDFPLNVHRNTWNASRAAACADEQGKFWEYHDALYQTQDQWNGEATNNPDPFLKDLAKKIGLNTSQFDQCVDSKKTQAKVQAHYTIASQRANLTPTFYFNGKKVEGALPFDDFVKEVNEAKTRPASGNATVIAPSAGPAPVSPLGGVPATTQGH